MFFKRLKKKESLLILTIIFLALFTRLVKLDWGDGFFFHPDENNMAWAVERLQWPRMDPQFFAYGQLPLYLAYFLGLLINFFGKEHSLTVSFPQSVILLRFCSAVFSLAAIYLAYRLGQLVFKKKKFSLIYALLLIFSPGLIQTAHFGTTEAILVFSLIGLTYFSALLAENKLSKKGLILTAFLAAAAIASKASGVIFLFPVLIAFLLWRKKEKNKKAWFLALAVFLFSTAFFVLLFSPFYLLKWQETLRIVQYEASVAAGRANVFYTRQFIDNASFLFPWQKIFPWVIGLPLYFFLLLSGLVFFFKRLKKKSFKKPASFWLVFHSAWLPWLVFNSFLFAKWTRFFIPIIPFLVFLAVWFLEKWEKKISKTIFFFLVFLFILPGLIFLKIYFQADIRLRASQWINKNLPTESVILSEAGNVVNLPIRNEKSLRTVNFDFYNLEERPSLKDELDQEIAKADYILIPSRRIFANQKRGKGFPLSGEYYEKLFSGELGFFPLIEFRPFNKWQELLVGSDLSSEETWTVFDHPTIRLYQRQ